MTREIDLRTLNINNSGVTLLGTNGRLKVVADIELKYFYKLFPDINNH